LPRYKQKALKFRVIPPAKVPLFKWRGRGEERRRNHQSTRAASWPNLLRESSREFLRRKKRKRGGEKQFYDVETVRFFGRSSEKKGEKFGSPMNWRPYSRRAEGERGGKGKKRRGKREEGKTGLLTALIRLHS